MSTITVQGDPQYSISVTSNLPQTTTTVESIPNADNMSVLIDTTNFNVNIVQDRFIFTMDLEGYPIAWTSGNLPVERIEGFEDAVNDLIDGDEVSVEGSGYVVVNNTDKNYVVSVTGLQPSGNYSLVGHTHTASDITDFNSSVSGLIPTIPAEIVVEGSGYVVADLNGDTYTVYVTGLQPSGDYAIDNHTHTASDITDFNTAVSGLIPTIPAEITVEGSGYVVANLSDDTYTIYVTGLQPSGNYSLDNHTHISSDVTDFNNSVSGLLIPYAQLNSPNFSGIPTAPTATSGTNTNQIASTAFVRTEISNLVDSAPAVLDTLNELAAALGDDPNFATTVASGLAQKSNIGHSHVSSDITNFNSSVSGLLPVINISAGSGIGISSSSGDFTVSVTGTFGLTSEEVDDRVSNLLVGGSYINLDYNDNSNTLTINASGLQPSGNYSLIGHFHSSSDITDFNNAVSGLIPVKNILSGTGINVSNASGVYTIEATGSGVLSDQAKSLVTTVFNKTGSPIPKMTAVYIDGGQGDLPTVSLAIATSDMTSAGTYGLTYEAISNMQSGKVIVFGALTGLDTDQFNPTAPMGDVNGSIVYLNPSVSGSLTLTKPSAPNHIVAIGTVVRTHQNEGVIEVRVQNGFELEELHNVAISGVTNGQFLQYNSGTQLWVPSSSGNFTTLLVNSTGVSLVGHTHTSSDITDFNTAVSGLIPTIPAEIIVEGSGYVVADLLGDTYTLYVTGLQPSGDYALDNHTHGPIQNDGTITDYLDISEITEPATPGADVARFYATDISGNTVLQWKAPDGTVIGLGRDNLVTAKNVSGSAIIKGQVCHISGGIGNSGQPEVNLAKADDEATMPAVLVAVEPSLANNDIGRFMSLGILRGFDTSMFSEGAKLYVSPSTAGMFTTTPPTPPDFRQRVAVVINSHAVNGTIIFIPAGVTTPTQHASTHSDGGNDPITIISSQISGFNTAVSGLLPSEIVVEGSGYVVVDLLDDTYTISVTGLQPSGDYSLDDHSHEATDITDFESAVIALLPLISGVDGYLSKFSGTDDLNSSVIYQSGTNIGIGTTSPGKPLEISYNHPTDSAQTGGLRLTNPTSSSPSYLEFGIGGTTGYDRYGICSINNIPVFRVTPAGSLQWASSFYSLANINWVNANNANAYINLNNGAGVFRQSCVTSMDFQVSSVTKASMDTNGWETKGNFRLNNGTYTTTLQHAPTNNRIINIPDNSGTLSLDGHTHTTSDITDFSSSVSGLLSVTDIIGGTNISVVPSGSIYTINVTGSLGLTTEEVDDRVASLLIAGTGINLDYNDGSNTLTINASGTFGNISIDGAIGSISGLPIITTTSGVLTTGAFGSSSGEFCEGDDSRLSDSRTPTLHAINHANGGDDELEIDTSQITSGTLDEARLTARIRNTARLFMNANFR